MGCLNQIFPVALYAWLSIFVVTCRGQLNRAPEFLFDGDMARFSLGEDTPIGLSVYTLRASDPEGTRITYGIISEYFSVHNQTGEVTLIKGLDREKQDYVDVVISATDVQLFGTKPNIVESNIVVEVTDVNDNAPKFQDVPYMFTVDEATLPGTTLYDGIVATDKDIGLNAQIVFTCDESRSPEACKHFEVATKLDSLGRYQGIVKLKESLDYEESPIYLLTVKAEDSQETNKKTSFVNVIVNVRDFQDQLPVFENSPYFAAVAEGTPSDMSLMSIHVQDGDRGASRPLHIELIEPMGYFKVGSITNDSQGLHTVTIATSGTSLDHEDPIIVQHDGQYTFQIKATELENGKPSEAVTTTTVTILVTDVNDNAPVLSRTEINISIPEDIRSNFLLSDLNLMVDDMDSGENGKYELALDSDDISKEIFALDERVGEGRTPINIRIVNSSAVDYENQDKREFHFKVVAWDQLGRQSLCLVHVSVDDSNDNSPIFSHQQYHINASENLLPGTALHTIVATDADSGINGQITYSLQGFGAEWFNLNSSSGEISVADCGATTCLDYEKSKRFTLTYSARDALGRAAATSIVIDITDENDNPPTFAQREVIRNIPASATKLSPPLLLKASDKDSALNGNNKVRYSIVKSDAPGDLFSLDTGTGEILLRRELQSLYNSQTTHSYSIHVVAEDGGTPSLSEDAYVIITITGTAEGRFFFVHPLYNASILESDNEGTVIAEVTAIDATIKDTVVSYQISNGSHDNFVIDSTSGVVSVAPNTTLDLDISPKEYTMTVEAVTSESPLMQTATTIVYVSVADVNNKPPTFAQDYYTVRLNQDMAVGEKLVQVTATDPDEDHLLQYSIILPVVVRDRGGVLLAPEATANFNSAFQMNSTSGEVSLSSLVDHSAATVAYVTVKVVDINANQRSNEQSAIVTILVYIENVRHVNPIFPPPWTASTPQIVFSIPEEPVVRSTLFTLTAKNPSGNGPVTFHVLQDENKYVFVDEKTGVVTLQKRLDYEALSAGLKHISFVVQAIAPKGEGIQPTSSSATVIIDVQDINDNSPIFAQESYHVSLAESSMFPHTVLTVRATDKDQQFSFGDVRYSLNGDSEGIFTMDHITGTISLRKGVRLDRETKVSYHMKVTATDNPEGNGNKRSTSALLFVEVLDVNDNAPVFVEPLYQAIIPENVAPGFGIKQVKANDYDLGESSHITYSIDEASQLKDYLSVNESTGSVSVANALSGKGRSDPYKVIIRATDHGEPSLSTDVHMLLFITDVSTNDGIPTFVKPETGERIQVAENSPAGSVVTVVQARDPDDPNTESGRLRYSFLGEGSSIDSDQQNFAIDPIKGTITTRHALDREDQKQYTVVVMVRDFGYPPQHRARILNIEVVDVDDHEPLFPRPKNSMPLQMSVEEEVPVGTTIGFIEATDLDEGDNAAIDYFIIDGNSNNTLGINRTSDNRGEIYVANRIDCEQKQSYLITIQARKLHTDKWKGKTARHYGQPDRSTKLKLQYDAADLSMAQVLIGVRDIDDHHPVFVQTNLTTGIRATSGSGLDVFTFKAIDNDTTSSSLTYELKDVIYNSFYSDRHYSVKSGFKLDAQSGVLRTATSMATYENGYFSVAIRASSNNKSTSAVLRVFVLQGRELLKFTFNKPLAEVRKSLTDFRKELRGSLSPARPIDVNLYDSEFSVQEGAVNASSLCFQFVINDSVLKSSEAEALLDLPNRPKLGLLYHNYGVRSVEDCEVEGKMYRLTWVEICVLVVAGLMGAVGLLCGVIICSLHQRYKKKMNRTVYQVVVGAPADTNGNGYSTINRQRIHEWQERSPPPIIRDFTYGTSYA